MITKFNKFLIKESPDHIDDYKGNYLYVTDHDAVGFQCDPNKDHTKVSEFYLTDERGYHSSMGEYRSYPGRLWKDSKVMTFWVYPNPTLFKDIVKHLEKKLKIKIFNNGWYIEVIKTPEGEIKTKEVKPGEDYSYGSLSFRDAQFVPIEEYIGSEDVDFDQRKMHLMGWAEKQRLKEKGIKLAPGFGSDRTAWDKPRNLAYRQTIYQEKKKD